MENDQRGDHTTIFGIDLGTTYSCIAYVDQYGKATVIPNAEGDLITPSVVLFENESNRVVGKEAKNSAMLSPEHVVSMIKRQMGKDDFTFEYGGVAYSPQEISSYILRKVAADAEQMTGVPVKEVVITCPAYFGVAEREATRQAGVLAGLNVREIINEPTAAALDYSFEGGQVASDQVAMVYDLGGGTFDVTIIQISPSEIKVIATGGDHQLGGHDWDERVVTYLAGKWREKYPDGSDPLDSLETLQDLWQKAETAKRALSAREETKVAVVYEGKTEGVSLSREQFDELTQGLLEQTIQFTTATLDIARSKGVASFDTILLVGGSTRMPQVRERLQREFPGHTIKVHDPDQSVAKGAAIYGLKLMVGDLMAGMTGQVIFGPDGATPVPLSPEGAKRIADTTGVPAPVITRLPGTAITNVVSHSYGVIAMDDRNGEHEVISNLIQIQDEVPANNTRTFGTQIANQATAVIRVVQNDVRAEDVDDTSVGVEIATAELILPPGLPKGSPIEMECVFDEQGLLSVTAKEGTQGGTIDIHFNTRGGLSEDEMDQAKARHQGLFIV